MSLKPEVRPYDETFLKKNPGYDKTSLGATTYENGKFVVYMNYRAISKYNLPVESVLRHEYGHVGSLAIRSEETGRPITSEAQAPLEETRQRLSDINVVRGLPSLAMHSARWRFREKQVMSKLGGDPNSPAQYPADDPNRNKDARLEREDIERKARERLEGKVGDGTSPNQLSRDTRSSVHGAPIPIGGVTPEKAGFGGGSTVSTPPGAQYRTVRDARSALGVRPELQNIVRQAMTDNPNLPFMVDPSGGVRTQAQQDEKARRGYSRTRQSYHIGGNAIDVVPLIDGKPRWDQDKDPKVLEAYQKLEVAMYGAANKLGYEFGPEHESVDKKGVPFKSWDPGHFSIPPTEKTASATPAPVPSREQYGPDISLKSSSAEKIHPNALGFIRAIGRTETNFSTKEAYSDATNRLSYGNRTSEYDYGYYQMAKRDVDYAVNNLGMSPDQARHLWGMPQNESDVKLQTAAVNEYLQRRWPEQYKNLVEKGDYEGMRQATRRGNSWVWFGLKDKPEEARKEYDKTREAAQTEKDVVKTGGYGGGYSGTDVNDLTPDRSNNKDLPKPGETKPEVVAKQRDEEKNKKGKKTAKSNEQKDRENKPKDDKTAKSDKPNKTDTPEKKADTTNGDREHHVENNDQPVKVTNKSDLDVGVKQHASADADW
jgi:peptidoglycan L-alanyl-D-glutamate endopeptidase CwlK